MAVPGGPAKTLDDAVDELQKLVKLSEVSNDLQRATHSILIAHGSPPGPGGPPGGGSGGPRSPFDSKKTGYTDPSKGLFRWAKAKARKWVRGSRIGRGMKLGGKIGAGAGRSMGMGEVGVGRMAAAGGALGAVAGAAALLVVGFIKAKEAITEWTDAAFATAQRLSEVSGSMSAIMAEREIQQMMRDVRRGEATAGSTRELMNSEANRKEQELRIDIALDNLKNTVLSISNDVLADVLEPIAEAVEFIAEQFGLGEKKVEGVGLGGAAMTEAMAAGARIDAMGRNLMDIARAEAAANRGAVAPAGAAPLGRLP